MYSNDVTNKLITLCLNKQWIPIGYKTVKDGIITLAGGDNFLSLDIEYEMDENGNPNFNNIISMLPVTWDVWITLPIRPWDFTVHTSTREIRVPTVIISTKYDEIPVKSFNGRPSKDGIFKRDGHRCQYTNQVLTRDELSVDHVIPKSKGGTDSWENMVTCRRDLNSKKGNTPNEEIGLKLIRRPYKPKPIPVSELIRNENHPDWRHFVKK